MSQDITGGPKKSHAGRGLRRRLWLALCLLVFALVTWLGISYVALPDWWKFHEARRPALANTPRVTTTANGIPGDPLNLLVIGPEKQLVAAMLGSGWLPADPITLKTSIRIAESSVFHRPYEDAPISDLYLFGRKEDLGFEKPVGKDPRERHHVRFWQVDADGKMVWWGAATYDRSVGFSHTTGQITHHISPGVDAERDQLMADLESAPGASRKAFEQGFQNSDGRNGGGDPWKSDGRLGVVELTD